ncbi:TRAP transporter small permease [Salinarimonas soli]|uniref:TRAP transporter small permease protein n=1 Tax=Salinarimonas soli TaxID=1638099 RepID=A0A5B2VF25_9HYPH|nr:TRAP transporter small permease subunit [Salinarimonas soli]KAA2237544.1 TRAP transporter small permease [Salinarimonas soli]
MTAFLRRAAPWLARRAENVAAAMLAAMFAAFLVQIAFRYLVGLPTGWTHELSAMLWVWLVLWGAAFVVSERDEIRFDIVTGAVGPRTRRVMALAASLGLVALYGVSLPAVLDYIAFMKVERTAYLKVRFDVLFSIYGVFVVAAIARHLWLGWRALRGDAPATDATQATSGL